MLSVGVRCQAMCRKLVGVGNELLRGRDEALDQAGGELPEGSADMQARTHHALRPQWVAIALPGTRPGF